MYSIDTYRSVEKSALESVFMLNVPVYFGPHEVEDLFHFIQNHPETYFTLKDEMGVLLGGGGYHLPNKNKGRLSWFFVHPGTQGKGVGSQLVRHCLDEMEMKGVVHYEVWTSQYGEKFFGKFGFKKVEYKNDYWAEGIHLVRMVKEG